MTAPRKLQSDVSTYRRGPKLATDLNKRHPSDHGDNDVNEVAGVPTWCRDKFPWAKSRPKIFSPDQPTLDDARLDMCAGRGKAWHEDLGRRIARAKSARSKLKEKS